VSERVISFVENWVADHVSDGRYNENASQGDEAQAKRLAALCLQDAIMSGIQTIDVQEEFDDLAAFIAGEIAETRERALGEQDDDDSNGDGEGDEPVDGQDAR